MRVAGAPLKGVALVIDAATSARDEVTRGLRKRGFEVLACAMSDQALMLASRARPDLIVLELARDITFTFDVLAGLRSALPDAKIVILTSYGSVATAVRALRLGATNYLCRPASAGDVLWAARELPADPVMGAPESDHCLTLDEAIWEYIHRTLEASGSISEAARRLGLFRQSLKRMITKYRPPARRSA